MEPCDSDAGLIMTELIDCFDETVCEGADPLTVLCGFAVALSSVCDGEGDHTTKSGHDRENKLDAVQSLGDGE